MKLTEQEFERIVAEVIRRLKLLDAGQPAVAAGRDLTISERVVTMQSLEGKLAGATRVVVQSKAIVTPAVKDELKQRKIELIRQAQA